MASGVSPRPRRSVRVPAGLSFKKFGRILEEKAKADWNRVFRARRRRGAPRRRRRAPGVLEPGRLGGHP